MKRIIWIAVVTLLVSMMLIGMCGCNSSKHMSKGSLELESNKETELRDSVGLWMRAYERLKQEIAELHYAGVTFNNDCPPTQLVIDSNCNADSVKAVFERELKKAYANEVKILADGTIEAKGNLRTANYQKNKMQLLLKEKSDSISLLRNASLKQKEHVRLEVQYKDKIVKRSIPWWLYALCFVAGCVFWNYLGSKIKLIIQNILLWLRRKIAA